MNVLVTHIGRLSKNSSVMLHPSTTVESSFFYIYSSSPSFLGNSTVDQKRALTSLFSSFPKTKITD